MKDITVDELNREYSGAYISTAVFIAEVITLTLLHPNRIATVVTLSDEGQSCCEIRYMSLDGDNVNDLVGARFHHVQVRGVASTDDGDSELHEINFVEIVTDKGGITFSMHNEHNGYYGGIDLTVSVEES